jgi:hypothetical protein
MLLYRIEDKDGIGPYRTNIRSARRFSEEISDVHTGCRKHPVMYPKDTFEIGRCAMGSLPLLHEWFRGFLGKLKYHKFKVAIYRVSKHSDRHTGDNRQYTFDASPSASVLVEKFSIMSRKYYNKLAEERGTANA